MSLMSVRKNYLPFKAARHYLNVATVRPIDLRRYLRNWKQKQEIIVKNMSDTTEKFEAILHHVKIAGMSIMI